MAKRAEDITEESFQPANSSIFSLSGTADEYYVTICLCWFLGNENIYLSMYV